MTATGPAHFDYGSMQMEQGTEDTPADMAEDAADGDPRISAPTTPDAAFGLDASQMPSTDGQSKAITNNLK